MITAQLNNHRQSPRKVRLLADLVRGKSVTDALIALQFAGKRAALPMTKLLKSAVANATHNFQANEVNLFVKEIAVNQGYVLMRRMPRARGSAFPIRKKTSHVTLTLGEREGGKKPKKAAKASKKSTKTETK